MATLLTGFNNLLEQFLSELVQTFPELTDLKTIQMLVSIMRSANPRMILENFLGVTGKYHEKIFNEESSFFEDLENWKQDPTFIEEFASTEDEANSMFQKLVVFKDVWVDLTPQNKEHIWTYMQQLLVMGAQASKQVRPELCRQIIETAVRKRNTR